MNKRLVLLLGLALVGCTPTSVAQPAPTSSPTLAVATLAQPTPTLVATPTVAATATPQPATATGEPATATQPASSPTSAASSVAVTTATSAPTPGASEAATDCQRWRPVAGATDGSDLTPAAQPVVDALSTAGKGFDDYQMRLVLDPATTTVSGMLALTMQNRTAAAFPDLVFHLYPNLRDFAGNLTVGCVAFNGTPVTPTFEDGNWLMRVRLPEPLAPGTQAQVVIGFVTRTPQDQGSEAYGAFNREGEQWALASFYPLLARRLADGWDVLKSQGWGDYVNSDMARYQVAVTADPADGMLIGTGVRQGDCSGSPCTTVIGSGPQREFTLLQLKGWQQRRTTVGATTIVSTFPPEQINSGQRVLDSTADAFRKFSEHFGDYPYTEFDVVPVPSRTFSGVEYPGVIMIGEQFYDVPDGRGFRIEDVVVHEVAHQWWYNVVGNDVLRESWLDEGITSYSAEYLYNEWTGQQTAITQQRQDNLDRQGLGTTPIDKTMGDYGTARAYIGVIYGRAPLFLAALRKEIGDEAFANLLQTHYEQNRFGVATTAGFQKEAEQIAGRSLRPFFEQWFQNVAP